VVKKGWLIAGAGAAAIGVGAVAAARKERSQLSTRAGRNLALAKLGGRLGRRQAAHRARRAFASAERREELDREHELQTAADVAAALGDMKGALMKIGQLASFLDDGLPEPMREALATLQQDAPPMSAELAAEVIERELGSPPDRLFAKWDPVPMAAASIGQVHRAMTHDGVAVAVKVQYPGVDEAIRTDLDNSNLLINLIGMMFPGFEPAPLVEELKARLTEELDYRLEAKNQQLFAHYYRGHPFIHVPAVVPELSSDRVLTTELASGARFSEVADTWSKEERDLAGEAIYRFVFRSLYRLRAFNGDPHPGNYLFRPGGRVTFLDFGLVKHFESDEIDVFEQMIRTMVLSPDPAEFRSIVESAGLLAPAAPPTDEEVASYFGHFYEVLTDEEREVTHEYASETVQQFIVPGPVSKWANVPPAFVIIQRINLGLYAILAALGSRANWRRVSEELWPMVNGPASTELGKEEAAWLARKT
jgi:predicted unusual protein kinase regulating ubiquinone biosynthesis (AarF/ABC1/UbiB family)